MKTKPKNDYEALVLALRLAVTAPTEEKYKLCLAMAEEFASKLNDSEIAKAKREAELPIIFTFRPQALKMHDLEVAKAKREAEKSLDNG